MNLPESKLHQLYCFRKIGFDVGFIILTGQGLIGGHVEIHFYPLKGTGIGILGLNMVDTL